jgi:thiol:disulfide interchange protein DsbD
MKNLQTAAVAVSALLSAAVLPARAGNVEASLISARAAARPGESFSAGLRLKMRDGWHVYWRNPGDAGLPPKLDWLLSRGWTAGLLEWPAPKRLESPPLTNFGYSDEVVLPLTLTMPADAVPGSRTGLRAAAEWLECREICVPGSATLALEVKTEQASREYARHAAELTTALTAVPRPCADCGITAAWNGTAAHLRVRGRHPLAEFFPQSPDVFENARSVVSVSPLETELVLKPAQDAGKPKRIEGVLLRPGFPPVQVSVPVETGGTALRFLVIAFLGGLLLNLMPCVFPVLAFKALGLLGQAGRDSARIRREALSYTAGVVLSCEAVAAILIAVRRAGGTIGWGGQFQSPWLVAALALLFLAAGLGLLGFFEFGARWMGVGSGLSAREGRTGAFFSGVFAMIAAAPCTAPFMGAAIGWALTRQPAEAFAVFGALGLGAAAPYAALSSWPALIRRLPRPGVWMLRLKQILSVPMFATALWLIWVLWQLVATPPPAQDAVWKSWSPEAVAEARAARKTVLVDFTAAWCLSCQVNERTALAAPVVRAALASPGVAAFRADWTGRDARINAELAKYGRDGVPLYVVHPKGGPAVLLPELLTPGLVLDALGAGTKP